MSSEKYGRTFHYPFSPGTSSDDRINDTYWEDLRQVETLVHTEKLDGENNCLSRHGVFARSHAAPTTSPWTATLRTFWAQVRRELGDLEIFLENLYAVHSIEYRALPHHFFVFAVRERGRWLSWEEVVFYAGLIDLPTVPVIAAGPVPTDRQAFESGIAALVQGPGAFAAHDARNGAPCTMEGIVSRNAAGFEAADFGHNVFKWVRRGHVTTGEHWTRHWKRARLKWEGGADVDID
ncbi:RNA ligase family protein [Flaviaesturariibacter amylovorans]|uniref:RNA ligase family protein n=1 Tax=Flaviaesturariibacter amylovorans TaxID=1084520 RepID=A0ABP8GEV7_9BACT